MKKKKWDVPFWLLFVGNHKNRDNHTIPAPAFQGADLYKIHKTILGNLPIEIVFTMYISPDNIQISFFNWIVLFLPSFFSLEESQCETVAF